MLSLFLSSLLIGVAVAMPVGPIGVLCIDHSLRGGIRMGVAAGVGAALADALFGFISGLGSSAFIASLGEIWHFRLLAAILIFYIGIRNVVKVPTESEIRIVRGNPHRATFTTFLLTLSNPMTLLCFAGIFVGLGIAIDEKPWLTASLLGVGIFIGSTTWWLMLSYLANHIQKKMNFNPAVLSKISGTVLIAFGFLLLFSLVF